MMKNVDEMCESVIFSSHLQNQEKESFILSHLMLMEGNIELPPLIFTSD